MSGGGEGGVSLDMMRSDVGSKLNAPLPMSPGFILPTTIGKGEGSVRSLGPPRVRILGGGGVKVTIWGLGGWGSVVMCVCVCVCSCRHTCVSGPGGERGGGGIPFPSNALKIPFPRGGEWKWKKVPLPSSTPPGKYRNSRRRHRTLAAMLWKPEHH